MKKILLGIVLTSFLLTGCEDQEKKGDASRVVVSKIIEIEDGNVVGQIDDKTIYTIPLDELEGKKIKVGNTLKVTYDYVTMNIKKIEIE